MEKQNIMERMQSKMTPEQKAKMENNMELHKLKVQLANTDFKAIKFAEGEISAAEYEPIKIQRRDLRKQINELEKPTKL